MPSLSTLSFAAPWLLAALAALPVIWWILRVTPPAPRRVRFPAIAFLFGLSRNEETPAHTPLWLLLLRMLIAALIILGLAGPTLNAHVTAMKKGPLTLFIDNGWPSARNWDRIKTAALELIDEAGRARDTVVLVRTAPAAAQSFGAMSPSRAKGLIEAMTPSPWRPQRMPALKDWQASKPAKGRLIWLSDGLADSDGKAFAAALAKLGPYEVQRPSVAELPLALRPAQSAAQDLSVTAVRAASGAKQEASVSAFDSSGKILARQPFTFDAGHKLASATLNLPLEMRNQVARVSIDSERSAGAVTLLDQRWQRQAVGLVSGSAIGASEPLLGELYYVERALNPYAEVRKGAIDSLLKSHISVLVLADVGHIVDADVAKIKAWIQSGGVLIRFAGPHLAAQSDQLVPVKLRQGGRTMGGTLSWAEPQRLGPFDKASPFYGLKVPSDVTVHRQVLAEPSLELASRTWARLADGTPLVTAEGLGKGHIVLFHVTANTDWSNLPISGLFVDMLQRLVDLASAPAAASTANLAQMASLSPRKTLDGFGVLKQAPATATPIPAGDLSSARPGAQHPPGLYGPADSPRAFNPTTEDETLTAMTAWPPGATSVVYAAKPVVRIGPWLLVAALLLALFDGLAALDLMGKISLFRPASGTAALFLALTLGAGFALAPHRALADDTSASVLAAALKTHLAYVVTGDAQVDAMSKAGLEGLTRRLIQKTALEPAPPVGLDIDKDPLVLYPLIYWPVTADAQALSSQAQRKLDHYIKTGGMVLFDTQDEDQRVAGLGAQTPAAQALQRLLAGLDIPPLTPVPHNHVLTRTFYLLNDFPGRFDGGRVWVEANGSGIEGQEGTTGDENGAVNDGVSPVIIGANDWAAAWAIDKSGRPIAAVIPGGEHQREMAYRFGVNLAIYALTGNYKGDEVHTRELIKRLGE